MAAPLDDLFTLLRLASVSTDPKHNDDTRAAADWLTQKLISIGLTAALHETARHPVVVARNRHRPGRRTGLLYGHYDVQPADPLNEWTSAPFEPVIRNARIFCRGSTDNKGQLMAHVAGLEKTMREEGDLPVNLICLFEGEEEIGSPTLKPFLQKRRDELKCDVVAISDAGMV